MSATFPGGTSVSRLAVYPDTAADGLAGGTPHLHTVSAEAYVVTGGAGELHTLDTSGFRVTPLRAGDTVWFTPGTIHRAVDHDGLRIVVVMANAGLPEAGDAVMTFPPEIAGDPGRYREAAHLPAGGDVAAAVRHRRDLAVGEFQRLAAAARAGDLGPLETFYEHAAALVRPLAGGWRALWTENVEAQTRQTADRLAALAAGDGRHLRDSALLSAPPNPDARWGMCGRLHTHDLTRPVDLHS